MSKIDDILKAGAKQVIGEMESERAAYPASRENDNMVDIKLAKAKAGVRVRITRTIRICAVAAALMIGLVCALFMGADEVEDPDPATIQISRAAYMWENNNPDSEWNGKVIVDLNLTKVGERITGMGNPAEDVDIGAIYEGYISIKTPDGKAIVEFDSQEIEYTLTDNKVYYDGIVSTTVIRDGETGIAVGRETEMNPHQMLFTVCFGIDMNEFEIRLWEKIDIAAEKYPERLDENKVYDLEKYSIYVASGASSREEAIALRYQNDEKGVHRIYADSYYEENKDIWK